MIWHRFCCISRFENGNTKTVSFIRQYPRNLQNYSYCGRIAPDTKRKEIGSRSGLNFEAMMFNWKSIDFVVDNETLRCKGLSDPLLNDNHDSGNFKLNFPHFFALGRTHFDGCTCSTNLILTTKHD